MPHPTTSNETFTIFGAKINATTVQSVVETIDDWIQQKKRDYIILTGAHGIIEMQHDKTLLQINNNSGLTTPDGMPAVWIGRLKGIRNIEKTYAPDIMRAVFKHGIKKGYNHYFYGGDEQLLEDLRNAIQNKYPGIKIAGTYAPPFRPLAETEKAEILRELNASQCDIVWVGLGCPKQDKWIAEFRLQLNAPVLIGVGAGFDFIAGKKPEAPYLIKHSGFEWLFRLVTEPRRLWPRYSKVVPKFLYLSATHIIKKLR